MLRCFRPTHTTQCLSWTATGHRSRTKASGSSSSAFRKLRNGLLVLAVACPVAACGGSDQGGKVASALTNGGGALNFDQLKGAHSASCKQSGSEHSQPVFACTWLASDGTQQQGEWVLESGSLARVSEGGDTGSPPSDASAATAEVNKVVQERGASGNEACVKRSSAVIQGNTVGLGQNNFVCLLLDSSGAPLQANGSPVAENWNWNGDGTVAKELLDFTPGDIAAALSALNTSGNTGDTGSGNTGNTGSGNAGSGNTGAGNTGVPTTATQPTPASGTPACVAPSNVVAFSVSGTTCTTAIGLVHALLKSDVCAVGDSYGNAASSTCQIDGFDCSATLGYPPGQTAGEESAVLACTEESDSGAHVRFIEPV